MRRLPLLLLLGASNSCCDSKRDIDAPYNVASHTPYISASAQHLPYLGTEQGIEAICAKGCQHKKSPQEEGLHSDSSSGGINELWEKGIEEKRCFRIQ